jgi:hypothetical protein
MFSFRLLLLEITNRLRVPVVSVHADKIYFVRRDAEDFLNPPCRGSKGHCTVHLRWSAVIHVLWPLLQYLFPVDYGELVVVIDPSQYFFICHWFFLSLLRYLPAIAR